MNKKIILALFCYLALQTLAAQNITEEVYNSYEKYKENALEERRIKHYMLQPLISRIAENKKFTVNKVGESIEGRDLKLISIGSGRTDIFLWSQMHGNEPTATQAIFDLSLIHI